MNPDDDQPGGPGGPDGPGRHGGYGPYGGYSGYSGYGGYSGYPGGWPGPRGGRLNALAVASLVCGILQALLFALPVFALLALVFGLISLGQIRRRGDRGKSMAVAGTALGGCGLVLTVFGILVAMSGSH